MANIIAENLLLETVRCKMMVEGTDTTVLLPRREGAKNFLTFSKRLIVKNS